MSERNFGSKSELQRAFDERGRPNGAGGPASTMERVSEETVLACDYCHREMSFHEYSTHLCDGLRGLNPLQEKLRKARWRAPAEVRARGSVVEPRDFEIKPEALFDPERRLQRRVTLLARAGMVGIFLCGMLVAFLLHWAVNLHS